MISFETETRVSCRPAEADVDDLPARADVDPGTCENRRPGPCVAHNIWVHKRTTERVSSDRL